MTGMRTIVLSCLLCVAALVRAADAPPAEATQRPLPMILKGIADDGTIHVVARKAVTLTIARPYKRLEIAGPDIASVDPIGPTQVLVTGLKEGETSMTIWDEANVQQTVDVRVAPPVGGGVDTPKAGKWEITGTAPPLKGSRIPGFIRFDLNKGSIDVPLSQIAAVVSEGEGETSATRIVFAPTGSKDLPREISIPAKVQTSDRVFSLLAGAANTKP